MIVLCARRQPPDGEIDARGPCAAARWQRRAMPAARRPRPALQRAETLRRRLPQPPSPLTEGRLQIVDGLDPVQLPLETVELAAKLGNGPAVVRAVAIDLREDLPASLHDTLVLVGARLVKEGPHLLLAHVLDAVDMKQGRLAPERFNFLHEPLEQLGRLGRLRQDP